MLTIEQADATTIDWIRENVDLERAAATWDAQPFRCEHEKRTERIDYTPGYNWAWDQSLGEVMTLVEIQVADCYPKEGGWDNAINMASTLRYVQWFEEGHRPPPIIVIRNKDGDLVSLNRRRWLAAREVGIETLPAWYSPSTKNGMYTAWALYTCRMADGPMICERKPEKSCAGCHIFKG